MLIRQKVQQLQELIHEAELSCQRLAGSTMLLAVSKQQTIKAIESAYEAGIINFGENYYQEAKAKIDALHHRAINWHFIGPIQSNKTKGIAANFSWVHSINRTKIAQLLSQYRLSNLPPLNVCLHINLIDEASKAGVLPQQAQELAQAVSQLPNLKLRGLMTIPPPQDDPQQQFNVYMQLSELKAALNKQLGLSMDTLSMGMSDDLIPAINAGATIVRIGRALFGERQGTK